MTSMFGDRYIVESELGHGGMTIVYRAIDRKHDRPVALKIAARLQHPHILTLIDLGEADGNLFYVTPRLEGETLVQRI